MLLKRMCHFALLSVIAFVLCFNLAGCSKATGACEEEETKEAVANAYLDIMRRDLGFLAGSQPGAGALSDEEWNAMRLGIGVTVDNIRQTGTSGDTFECTADVVVMQQGGKESIPVTFKSKVMPAGNVNIEITSEQD